MPICEPESIDEGLRPFHEERRVAVETPPAAAPARRPRRRYRWVFAALFVVVCAVGWLAVGILVHDGNAAVAPTRLEMPTFDFQAVERQDHLLLTWNRAATRCHRGHADHSQRSGEGRRRVRPRYAAAWRRRLLPRFRGCQFRPHPDPYPGRKRQRASSRQPSPLSERGRYPADPQPLQRPHRSEGIEHGFAPAGDDTTASAQNGRRRAGDPIRRLPAG